MRRVFLLVGAIVFLDTAFYAAIVPLLPHYVHELGLSQTDAGLLTASYAAGTLIASLPGGAYAARFGARAAVLVGLALLAASSVAFGFGTNATVLEAARFAQGIGGAFSWAGGFAWLMGLAPSERRGEVSGAALSAAIFGVVVGPALGAAAVKLGAREVFTAVGVVALGLAARAYGTPPIAPSRDRLSMLAGAGRPLWGAFALFSLPAAFSGAIDVLLPLRLDELGASAVLIGAVFLAAAVVEALITPIVGRFSDRSGRLAPLTAGLVASAALGIVLPLLGTLGPLIAATIAIVAALAMFWAPASALLSEEAELIGLDQALAGALMNLAWAGGQVLGSNLGGGLADASGAGLVYAILVAACLLSLALILRAQRAGEPALPD